ncbi:6731_t:CDS:1, partial [Gigaspora rosea]
MAYVKCKIHEKGHEPYLVKALVDTSSYKNIIRKSLVDKLGIKYSNPPKYFKKKVKDALGIVESLELSFRFKGKDKLVSGSDEVFNDFVVCKETKADLVLGMQWLWLHETKIDSYNERISIYGGVVPFYKNLFDVLESDIS